MFRYVIILCLLLGLFILNQKPNFLCTIILFEQQRG